MASQNGHCEVVEALLEAKADANMKTNVCESCSSDGVGEYTFTCFACYNIQNGATALHIACLKGHLKVAETLITAHASVNAQAKVSVHCNKSVHLCLQVVNV